MLRIHFTSDDLANTRFAAGPDPLWEVLLSLHALRGTDDPPMFRRWRRHARTRVGPSERLLLDLAPPIGYSPDFLTPAAGARGLDAGIDAILTTPPPRLRADLAELAAERPLPPWCRPLADGDPVTLDRLGRAIRTYYRETLDPYWNEIRASIDAERGVRARSLIEGGVGTLLTTLHPDITWSPPVLRVRYPVDQDLFLAGRGLTVLPSYFCWGHPIALRNPELPPVLVYPIQSDHAAAPPAEALGRLMGRTRAAVLAVVAIGCTTSELARRLDISPAAASQHAAVLRDAGLLTTRRIGPAVQHTLTPLGADLLRHRPAAVPLPR